METGIIKGNKLISEFLGKNFDIVGRVSFYYSSEEDFPFSRDKFSFDGVENEVQKELDEFGYNLSVDVLSFHTSFDLLMEVVEKIEAETNYNFLVISKACYAVSTETNETFFSDVNDSKIMAVWNVVVDFITWFNKNNE